MVYEYRFTPADRRAYLDFFSGKVFVDQISAPTWEDALLILLACAATYVEMLVGHFALAAAFFGLIVFLLVRIVLRPKRLLATTARGGAALLEGLVRIEVEDDGIRETARGVESFARWESIASFTLFRDSLFLRLSNEQLAIIPRVFKTGRSFDVHELVRMMKLNDVPERSVAEVQAEIALRVVRYRG